MIDIDYLEKIAKNDILDSYSKFILTPIKKGYITNPLLKGTYIGGVLGTHVGATYLIGSPEDANILLPPLVGGAIGAGLGTLGAASGIK